LNDRNFIVLVEIIAKDAVHLLSMNTHKKGQKAFQDLNQTQDQQYADQLWEHLQPISSKNYSLRLIIQDFIRAPDNEIVQAIFRHQLSKFLKEDKTLAKELKELISCSTIS